MKKVKLFRQQICLIFFILPLIKSILDIDIPKYSNLKVVTFTQNLNSLHSYHEFYILHFKLSNKLQIYNSQTNLKINVLNLNASIYGKIIDLDQINSTHCMLYSQLAGTSLDPPEYIMTQLNVLTLQKLNYFNVTTSSLNIQITKTQTILLYQNKSISRFNKLSKAFIENIQITNSYLNASLKSTICQLDNTHYFMAVYVPLCYIKVFLCDNTTNCTQFYVNNNERCDINKINKQKQLVFNDDCFSIIYEWEDIGLRILDLVANLLSYENVRISTIISTVFIDKLHQYIQIHRNYFLISTFSTNQSNSITAKHSYNFDPYYSESFSNFQYNLQQMKVFLNSTASRHLRVYQQKCVNTSLVNLYGLCVYCPLNCKQCNLELPEICYQCKQGFSVNQDYSCKKTQIKVNPLSSKSVAPIFQQEATIQTFIKNSFDNGSDYLLDNIFNFFQFVPISFLFMRFINFWSICSMYLFLDVQMPEASKAILNRIYEAINKSVFQFLPFNLEFDLPIQQKFSEQLNIYYGISSDFFNSNIQNFLTMLFAYVLFGFVYFISKTILNHTQMGQVLSNVNYIIFILMQYASNMGSVYFNLITITQKGYQNNCLQKINLTLHMFFIVFSTLTPFFVFIFVRKQQEDDDQLIVKLKNAYDCMCNFFIVFTLVIGPLPIFFIANLLFYILSIYVASKQKQFRLNSMILASYLLIFHLGIVIMANFDSKSYPTLYHITGLVTNIIIFLGAIHEVLTLICGILYQLIIYLKSFKNNNDIIKDLHKSQQKISEKQNALNDFINKQIIKTDRIKKTSIIKGIPTQGTLNFKNIINLQQQSIKPNQKSIEKISNIKLISQNKLKKKIKFQTIHNNNSIVNDVETRRKLQEIVGNVQNIQII